MKKEIRIKISKTMKRKKIKPKFYLGMLGKQHSPETRLKISTNTKMAMSKIIKKISGKNASNWKGNKVKYDALHSWLRKKYGKANKCLGLDCTKKSKTYDWANISGKYKRNKKHFLNLCRSCHTKLDKNGIKNEKF